MIDHKSILAMTAVAAFFSLFAGAPNAVGIAAFVGTVLAATAGCYLTEKQNQENRHLVAEMAKLEQRTEVEKGVAVAVQAQGELATWNYGQLVRRLQGDGYIILSDAT
ncbi:hypothetical protein [Sphingomonas sanguinis]|uniref:Lipoprotein n=1 Tax=Sphingomonas sanguinis TaxID=33051 RepID=A0A147HZ04_9SPHN|nr:hypothetical protein [Sphingomonas sanguinis]KTT70179.1 hypothetical protein NS319_08545 [Sphingomonas sanguinis]